MEEAFTSEHWIVRIYKVNKRPSLEPTNKAKSMAHKMKVTGKSNPNRNFEKEKEDVSKSASSASKKKDKAAKDKSNKSNKPATPPPPSMEEDWELSQDGSNPDDDMMRVGARYVGCFSTENMFETSRIYGGGPSGANLNKAMQHAMSRDKRFFATARASEHDGHSFAFDSFTHLAKDTPDGDLFDDACNVPCQDQKGAVCGCADSICDPHPKPEGEEHNRRWAVYEVVDQSAGEQ
jgi:hypothetical protein